MEKQIENLKESFYNDGFVYCILTNLKGHERNLVKIGKIEMRRLDTEQQVLDKLVRRYNTYYPDYEILDFMRTGNCHKAETNIFERLKLKGLHYKRELFFHEQELIKEAFDIACEKYPNIQDLLEKTPVTILTSFNNNLREKEMCQF